MIRVALLLVLVLAAPQPAAAAFPDSFVCTVIGYVFAMPDDEPDFRRSDGCQMIQHRVEGTSLLLYTREYWVLIKLPREGGQLTFFYRWGTDRAHIRDQATPIAWGRKGLPG